MTDKKDTELFGKINLPSEQLDSIKFAEEVDREYSQLLERMGIRPKLFGSNASSNTSGELNSEVSGNY